MKKILTAAIVATSLAANPAFVSSAFALQPPAAAAGSNPADIMGEEARDSKNDAEEHVCADYDVLFFCAETSFLDAVRRFLSDIRKLFFG